MDTQNALSGTPKEKPRIGKSDVAIPSAGANARRDTLNICKGTDCAPKSLPDICRFVDEKDNCVPRMWDVAVEDLLGRKPIHVEMEEIYATLCGKVILVTGGRRFHRQRALPTDRRTRTGEAHHLRYLRKQCL